MPRPSSSFERIFDRTWRPGHPFRPRLSPLRRWGIFGLLCFLSAVVAAYWFLTDGRRVKAMAESYLTRILGGRVEVKRATLSIFEGLRLDGVKVYADDRKDDPSPSTQPPSSRPSATQPPAAQPPATQPLVAGPPPEDALVFSAASFILKYNPDSIFSGKLEASQILAIDPEVQLCENLDTGQWNVQRIKPHKDPTTKPAPERPAVLPEISLRNGLVVYSQMKGGKKVPGSGGRMAIDGNVSPVAAAPDGYAFRLQSRGQSSDLGPVITGTFNTRDKSVVAKLENFEFGRDVVVMLPPPVRQWWKQHELSGGVNVPGFYFRAGKDGAPNDFRVEMNLHDVTLSAWPEEWLGGQDLARVRGMRDAFDLMRLAGLNSRSTGFALFRDPRDGTEAKAGGGAGGSPPLARPATPRRGPDGAGVLAAGLLPGLTRAAARPPVRQADDSPSRGRSSTRAASPRAPAEPEPPAGFVDALESIFKPNFRLENVQGSLAFTPHRVEILKLGADLEGNHFDIEGAADGYAPDVPAEITLTGDGIVLPDLPHYTHSLPKPLRDLFLHLRPHGTGNVLFTFRRDAGGARPTIQGQIVIVDGNVLFDRFPYPLRKATGTVAFKPDPDHPGQERCELKDIRGLGAAGGPNENNSISINASIAPLNGNNEVRIDVQGRDLRSEPALMRAFPPEAREALAMFDPSGTGAMPTFRGDVVCAIRRPYGEWKPFTTTLDVTLHEASGAFKLFPYPVHGLSGKLHVTEDRVDIIGASATRQTARGPSTLKIDGSVSFGRGRPLTPELTIEATNVPIDADLLSALPPERRAALDKLGVGGGALDARGGVFRAAAPPATTPPATGTFAVAGDARGDAPAPTIVSTTAPSAGPGVTPAGSPTTAPGDIRFEFVLNVRGATIAPGDGRFAVGDVGGTIRLTPDRLSFSNFSGRRGGTEFAGSALISLPTCDDERPTQCAPGPAPPAPGEARLDAYVTARNLPLDAPLYQLLPEAGRSGWDSVQPAGNVDAELQFTTHPGRAATSGGAANAAGANAAGANGAGAAGEPSFALTLCPQNLTATVRALPYRLDDVTGTLVIRPGRVTLSDVAARHGGARIALGGAGYFPPPVSPGDGADGSAADPAPRTVWDLRLAARDIPADDELRRAMPGPVVKLLNSLKLTGAVSFNFPKLTYLGGEAPAPAEVAAKFPPAEKAAAPTAAVAPVSLSAPSPGAGASKGRAAGASRPPASARAHGPRPPRAAPAGQAFGDSDLDLLGRVWFHDATLDVGLPVTELDGTAFLDAHIRAGRLAGLTGSIDAGHFRAADRPVSGFHAGLYKPADMDAMKFQGMQAAVAGGELAGQLEFSFPDSGASRFALGVVLRNMDVAELTRESGGAAGDGNAPARETPRGLLNASLAVEGAWGDPSTHRGRGDVLVQGRELYKIPLMMGLLQITNLSLPITSPFTDATARYMLEGRKVSFEQIELRAPSMLMQGNGWLDYGSKKVRLTFTTDNPMWAKVPVLGELIQGAKHELLKIHVSGSVQDPKVSASMLSTITTTVDEVTKGSASSNANTGGIEPRKRR